MADITPAPGFTQGQGMGHKPAMGIFSSVGKNTSHIPISLPLRRHLLPLFSALAFIDLSSRTETEGRKKKNL
jgi:hypothetical protein